MPKVSVIIPVFGVEKYIERCARSLFEQTLDDIEYLFIDDCTPDRSIKILKQVLEEYPQRKSQVIIHQMEKNSGQAAVRKWGMMNATGEYVIHCDSDDSVETKLYESMYKEAKLCNSDLVICDCNRTDGISEEIMSVGTEKGMCVLINQMLHGKVWWSMCNKLFKRSLYEGIVFPAGAMGEDMCICLQLITRCDSVSYVHLRYNYHLNPNSIIQNNSKENVLYKFNEICRNIEIVQSYFESQGLAKQYSKGLKYLEYNAKQSLIAGLSDDDVLRLWQFSYPGCFWSVLFDNNAPFKERVRCLLSLLRIYPIRK